MAFSRVGKLEAYRTIEELGESFMTTLASLPSGVTGDDRWAHVEAVALERRRRFAKQIVDEEAAPRTPMPPAISLRDRLRKAAEPVRYLIDSWWTTGGTVVLAAQFKAGKTTLTGNLLRSLVDGDPWLGRWKVSPFEGNVTLLDFEMDEPMLEEWLRAQRIRNADRINVVSLKRAAGSFGILDTHRRSEWAQRLRDVGTRVLILDCLRPALDAIGLDEHKDAGRWFVAFDELCREAGIQEVLVVHHMGHAGDRSRGDSRIRDWPAAEWRVNRRTEDPASTRFITAFGRGVNVPIGRLTWDADTRRVAYAGTDQTVGVDEDVVFDLLHLLEAAPLPPSFRRIHANRGKHSEQAIERALSLAATNKWIQIQDGPNRSRLHSITSSGRAWLDTRRQIRGNAVTPAQAT